MYFVCKDIYVRGINTLLLFSLVFYKPDKCKTEIVDSEVQYKYRTG
jgi:hypothetical protein